MLFSANQVGLARGSAEKPTVPPSRISRQRKRSFLQPKDLLRNLAIASQGTLLSEDESGTCCGRTFPVEAIPTAEKRRRTLLWTIFVILLVLWLLGIVSSYTLGGYIHILLVVALVVVLIRVIQGRNPIA